MKKKRGEGKQRFLERGDKLGQGVATLKRWGWLEPPYEIYKQVTHKLPVFQVRQKVIRVQWNH